METPTQAQAVKISGELTHDPDICRFHVDRKLADGWTLIFNSASDGKGSPLIDALYSDADHVTVEARVTYEDGRTGTVRADVKIRDVETAGVAAERR